MPQGRNRIKATPFIFLQDENADTNQKLNAIKMSEQPTPETDAAWKEGNAIREWTCRKLERERNEAREKYDLEAVENMLAVNKICHERDEARGELARIESLLLDPHAVFLNFLRGKIAKLDWANLEHIHGPHPARVERDEAREALKHIGEYGTEEINAAVELRQKLAQALVDLDNMQDQRDLAMKVIKRLEQERDETREALMKIEEVFIDSDDTYEDLIKMGNIARAVLEAAK